MPFKTQADVKRHNKRAAESSIATRQWLDIVNEQLEKGVPEGTAIKTANGVVKRRWKASHNT